MDFAGARRSMVENQLRTNRITDPAILVAMGRLPREAFVPEALAGIAYVDEDLPLGGGRFLMEPLALARLLQEAVIRPEDAALVIGAGVGYEAAVLASVARSVVAVESDAGLADRAVKNLAAVGMSNVEFVRRALAEGCRDRGPYDVILLGGAVAEVPSGLLEQLGEGGRMVGVVRRAGQRVGKGTVVARIHGTVCSREAFDSAVPWLAGFEPKLGFVF